MEFCKELLLLSLWTKSYGVTIQMKPLNLYFHMVLLVYEIWGFLSNFVFGHLWQWKAFSVSRVNDINFLPTIYICHEEKRFGKSQNEQQNLYKDDVLERITFIHTC